MNWKQIKEKVSKMTKDELEQDVIFSSEEYSISGVVKNICKASFDLLYDGEDHPSKLISASEAKRNGMDAEEIEMLSVEIPKGTFYIKLD